MPRHLNSFLSMHTKSCLKMHTYKNHSVNLCHDALWKDWALSKTHYSKGQFRTQAHIVKAKVTLNHVSAGLGNKWGGPIMPAPGYMGTFQDTALAGWSNSLWLTECEVWKSKNAFSFFSFNHVSFLSPSDTFISPPFSPSLTHSRHAT